MTFVTVLIPPGAAVLRTRQTQVFAVGVSLVFATLVGCKDSPTTATAVQDLPTRAEFRATIDGVSFVGSDEVYGQFVNGVLALAARTPDGRTIHISVVNQFRPDTVDIGAGRSGSGITGSGERHWRSNLVGGTGTVTITRITAQDAEGTFEFTAMPQPTTGAAGVRKVSGRFFVPLDLYRPLNSGS